MGQVIQVDHVDSQFRSAVTHGGASFFRRDDRGFGNLPAEAVTENGEFAIRWDGKVYPDRDEFYAKAMVGDQRLMSLQDDLYGFEVL